MRAASLVLAALTASLLPSHAGAGDVIAERFVGIWKLVYWEQRLADGSIRQAPNSVGTIIYTDTGHVSYVGMNPNRPKWA